MMDTDDVTREDGGRALWKGRGAPGVVPALPVHQLPRWGFLSSGSSQYKKLFCLFVCLFVFLFVCCCCLFCLFVVVPFALLVVSFLFSVGWPNPASIAYNRAGFRKRLWHLISSSHLDL